MDHTSPTGRFQHYELLRRADGSPWELGRGTMGVTYKAFDVNLRCEVALKVVNPSLIHHPNARERFVREARAAARLRHRNIASVYHLGNDGDRFFYAMEFIDGETLDALVRRQGPLSPDAALRVLLQVARALAAAARQGVIHRDIKPGNLMVVHEDDDDHRVVKLIDFGLARATAADEDAGNLTSNGFVGTPVYSSPEQMAEKPADARSDIYSLGVTAWFLLVGKPPFSGTVASIFQQHASKPPPWECLSVAVPAPVRALLAKMLEKDPECRPQSAVALRQEIDTCRERLNAVAVAHDPLTGPAKRLNSPPTGSTVASKIPPKQASPAVLPRELGPGMILKGRYEILRLCGEGNSGQVFQIRDRAAHDEVRALKIFRSELTEDTSKRETIAEEVRLILAAPHCNLIRLHAFERLGSRSLDFLVEEWLCGFTLLDLLASRAGALPTADALQILAQAAAAADHAAAKDLDRLDLALHQVHFHFPTLARDSSGLDAARDHLAKPLATWPRWTLKLNPLGAVHGGPESSTWSGDVTHLPGAMPVLDRDMQLDRAPESAAFSYLRCLARMVYETCGGVRGLSEPARGKYVSLPALGEQANAVVQRAILDLSVPYESSRAFYEALATATGNKILPLPQEMSRPEPTPSRGAIPLKQAVAAQQTSTPQRRDGVRVRPERELRDAGALALLNLSVPASEREAYASQTSVSERLALVAGGGRQNRGWLPLLAVSCLLAAALAAALFAVTIHTSARTKGPTAGKGSGTLQKQVAIPRGPANKPPESVPASPTVQSVSNDQPPLRDLPVPTSELVASTPVDISTPPAISPTPEPREHLAKVHIETRPSGAEVRLSGKLLGTAPLDVTLPPGEHQFVAHYRNWPEVRHTLHLDSDQLTAQEEIHVMPPTMIPLPPLTPSSAAKNHRPSNTTVRHDADHPSPTQTGNGIVHFPAPTNAATPSGVALEPFLPQATPTRRAHASITPFDQGGTPDASPRRRNPDVQPLQSEDGND